MVEKETAPETRDMELLVGVLTKAGLEMISMTDNYSKTQSFY